MHQQAQTQPIAPAVPDLPTVVVKGPGGGTTIISTPSTLTARDLAVLKARRSELSDQLQSVDSRRSKLLSQLQATGDETARKGLEDRIALLDKRQLQLESDLGETGRQLSSVPAGLVATTGISDSGNMFRSVKSIMGPAVGVLFIVLVLAPLARRFARGGFRHSSRGDAPGLSADAAQRLERIEQSIDAIAVEIERISEGQRFVTRLLSESQHVPAIGAGRLPEPVRANQ
jgi:hypothetical protein